jgi:uncharacterized protein (TIGR00297 family)
MEQEMETQKLPWQSWVVVTATLPLCVFAAFLFVQTAHAASVSIALGISLALALLVVLARAATPAAALSGGIISAALTLGTAPWYRSGFPALLTTCVLTVGATRFGRARKQQLGLAEDSHGRNAAQICANLGAAGIAASLGLLQPGIEKICTVAAVAALAEAAADTLASELGEVLGGQPWMITTLRRVPAGTDGAISLAGTAGGLVGAVLVACVASFTLGLTARETVLAILAAATGLFADSLLGATLERAGWLNNDAVNFLATISAAATGLALAA